MMQLKPRMTRINTDQQRTNVTSKHRDPFSDVTRIRQVPPIEGAKREFVILCFTGDVLKAGIDDVD